MPRQSAISQVATTEKQLAAASEGEQAAAEAYRMGRIGYESGKTPLMELLVVRRALIEARQLTIDARLARVRAWRRWLRRTAVWHLRNHDDEERASVCELADGRWGGRSGGGGGFRRGETVWAGEVPHRHRLQKRRSRESRRKKLAHKRSKFRPPILRPPTSRWSR
jgi:hypothetical protein